MARRKIKFKGQPPRRLIGVDPAVPGSERTAIVFQGWAEEFRVQLDALDVDSGLSKVRSRFDEAMSAALIATPRVGESVLDVGVVSSARAIAVWLQPIERAYQTSIDSIYTSTARRESDLGEPLTVDDIMRARDALRDAEVPRFNGGYQAFVSPGQAEQLRMWGEAMRGREIRLKDAKALVVCMVDAATAFVLAKDDEIVLVLVAERRAVVPNELENAYGLAFENAQEMIKWLEAGGIDAVCYTPDVTETSTNGRHITTKRYWPRGRNIGNHATLRERVSALLMTTIVASTVDTPRTKKPRTELFAHECQTRFIVRDGIGRCGFICIGGYATHLPLDHFARVHWEKDLEALFVWTDTDPSFQRQHADNPEAGTFMRRVYELQGMRFDREGGAEFPPPMDPPPPIESNDDVQRSSG